MEVLQRHFDSKNLEILRSQLYPNAGGMIRLEGMQRISSADAQHLDDNAKVFIHDCEPVLIQIDNQQGVAYQVPIPVHSDY